MNFRVITLVAKIMAIANVLKKLSMKRTSSNIMSVWSTIT